MRRDLAGFLADTSPELINRWLSTPKALGGAGMLSCQGSGGARLVTKKMGLAKNEYSERRQATTIDELEPMAVVKCEETGAWLKKAGGLPASVSPTAVVEDLVSGLVLKKGKKEKMKERIEPVVITTAGWGAHSWFPAPPAPSLRVDPLLGSGPMRSALRADDLPTILELVEPNDHLQVLHWRRKMSRNVWIDWMSGQLPQAKPSVFGVAADVCSRQNQGTFLPTGAITRCRVDAVNALLEMRARKAVTADRYWLRMCA
jgi:hypothetical protein